MREPSDQPTASSEGPREIQGPSAFGASPRRFLDLVWLTGIAGFKTRYAGSALGYLWTLLRPVAMFGVLYVFVTEILGKFAEGTPNYPVLLLFNILLFQFFAETTAYGMASLQRAAIVRKTNVPQLVMPLSSVLTVAIPFFVGLAVVFAWILAYGITPMWTWLLLPAVVLWLIILTSFVTMLLSSVIVRYKDVSLVWPEVSRALFFLSPVVYPIEVLPEGVFRTLEALNPLAPIFVQGRVWIIDPDAPTWSEFASGPFETAMPFVVYVALCALGWLVFSRRAGQVAEQL